MANFPVRVPTLHIYRGDTFTAGFVIKDSSTGLPRNLLSEGWTGWVAQFRPYAGSTESVSFTVDTSALNVGKVGVSLSAMQTSKLGTGVWDLQASQGETVRTWLAGDVDFSTDITHV